MGPNSVGVALNDGGAETLDAAHILLATGSEVSPLPPCPVDNAGGRIVDSTGALDLKEIPKTMAVVHAGVIGLEMGSVWRRLGTKVTVIEFLDHIVPGTDKDVGKTFLRLLKKQGMKFKLKTAVQSAEVADCTAVLSLNFMPCFLSNLRKVLPTSLSVPGTMWSRNSITVTLVPSRRQTEPISRPITPAWTVYRWVARGGPPSGPTPSSRRGRPEIWCLR